MVWTIEIKTYTGIGWYEYHHDVWEWHELMPTHVEGRPGFIDGLRHSFIDDCEHKVMVF